MDSQILREAIARAPSPARRDQKKFHRSTYKLRHEGWEAASVEYVVMQI